MSRLGRTCGRGTKSPGLRCHPLHGIWRGMLDRCLNSERPDFHSYGGRGITVCDRWLEGDHGGLGFDNFVRDMGERPSLDHTLDREDTNANYDPNNCVWSTWTKQQRNRRNNRQIAYNGETLPAAALAEKYGIPYHRFMQRINKLGWSIGEALLCPALNGHGQPI